MKKLLSLLSCLLLIGCGEKEGRGHSSVAGNDEGVGDPAVSKGEKAAVSPEGRIIGYWAPDPEKIIKSIELDPPQGVSAGEQKAMIAEIKELFDEDTANFLQLGEDGQLTFYDQGEKDVGSYSLVVDDEEGAPLRLNAKLDSQIFSMTLTGDTLEIILPANAQQEFPLLASRIAAIEATTRLERASVPEDVIEKVAPKEVLE